MYNIKVKLTFFIEKYDLIHQISERCMKSNFLCPTNIKGRILDPDKSLMIQVFVKIVKG